MQFAPEGSALLHRQLTGLGIQIRLGAATDGSDLEADFVVLAIGSRPNRNLAVDSNLPAAKGILADEHLQTAVPGIFAAGDAAELKGVFRPSAREASAQGRAAGANAAAFAAGLPLQPYASMLQPLMFKSGPVDLASDGVPWGPDCTLRALSDGLTADQYRALIIRNGQLAGVQAIGTRKEFDGWCKRIGEAL
jgi:nitrite reductase (NADH) large subunit